MINPLQWFDRSSLRSKFFLLGIFCLAVLAFPTSLYWKEARKSTEFSSQEIRGLAPARSLLKVVQRSQQFRGMAVLYLKNNLMSDESKLSILQKSRDLDLALNETKLVLLNTHQKEFIQTFDNISQDWQTLKQQAINKEIGWHALFVAMTNLVRQQLDLSQAVIDFYQLSLDPEADGYFLISASLLQLPELTEVLGQMRGLGAAYLTETKITEIQRNQMNALLTLSRDKIISLTSTMDKIKVFNGAQGVQIAAQYQMTQAQYQVITNTVTREILNKEQPTYNPDDFFTAFSLGINSYFSYMDYASEEIQRVLMQRIADKNQRTRAVLFYCFIVFLGAALFALRFIRNLIHQFGGEPSYASQIVKRITQGNLNEEIKTQHPDSLLADMQKMQQKLQENDRLKSEFISIVSHELRTPLTAMAGALSIVLNGKLGELPIQMRDLLMIAYKNSQRLTELIDDLLDIDKLAAGQMNLENKPLDLIPLMQDTVKSMTAYADKFGIHLEFVTNTKNVKVLGDTRRLQQVLTNLVSNAIKFSPLGETVYVNVSILGLQARVEVVDQGSGIPEEFRARIFQKFSQADSSDRRSQSGTGLGLAISKGIITQMGGVIGFHSSPGVGSCFFFELPLVEAQIDG